MKFRKLIRHGLLLWRHPRSARVASVPFVCLVMLMAWLFLNTMGSASDVPTRRSILFLFPHGTAMPVYEILYDTIRKTIQAHLSEPLDIYAEYLDRVRFPDESYQRRLFELLCDKYKEKHVDLWIGVGHGMDELVDQLGKDVLHEVPAIILGFEGPHIRPPFPEDRPRTTGVVAKLDIKKNLDLALSLHPDTERVYVVSGTAPSDRLLERVSRVALQEYESRVEVVYLSGLTLNDFAAQMGNLPPAVLSCICRL